MESAYDYYTVDEFGRKTYHKTVRLSEDDINGLPTFTDVEEWPEVIGD